MERASTVHASQGGRAVLQAGLGGGNDHQDGRGQRRESHPKVVAEDSVPDSLQVRFPTLAHGFPPISRIRELALSGRSRSPRDHSCAHRGGSQLNFRLRRKNVKTQALRAPVSPNSSFRYEPIGFIQSVGQ